MGLHLQAGLDRLALQPEEQQLYTIQNILLKFQMYVRWKYTLFISHFLNIFFTQHSDIIG